MTVKIEQLSKIWTLVLKDIEKKIPDRSFYTSFFEPCTLYSLEDGKAVITTNSDLTQKILSSDYTDMISESLRKITESDYVISIVSKVETKNEKTDNTQMIKKTYFENSILQSKYTFENFVVGKSNSEAYKSALYVAKNQGKFNPLFIYSKSGLGKTHLLHAIGNSVKDANPNKKVLYITSEDFVDEFVKFVRGDSDRESLKDFFRTIDYLLIDDIQFLAGKTATETMFFNIFNIMVSLGKQIVMTSDRSPSQLEGLEDRLVSRFAQGLSISIEKPEKITLIEILKMKIKANGFNSEVFDDDALDYIAINNSTNIRILEGALNRILFFNVTSNNTNKISLDIVKQAFAKETDSVKKGEKLSAEKIISAVSRYYNLTDTQLTSNVRTLQIALARAIAMYLCRTILDMSFTNIGTAFNKKDHTTVMAACKKVDNMLKTNESMKKAIKQLTSQLKA